MRSFPWWGYLLLGLGALAAAVVFVVRAIAVEPTVERLVSAAVFAALGVFWLVLTGLSRSSGRPAER
jgi:hypothetical protein